MWMVEALGLKKTYMLGKVKVQVLRGVNLRVKRGEFMSIMGPSGSGKTTLLNLIGALDRPTEGRILVDGVDLSKLKDNELAEFRNRKIGFVFQFFNLIPRLTALGNVELPMALAGVPREERRRRALELLKMVGLSGRVNHKPSEMSGGEQQRVAIARALSNNPSIVLCDEITGNLDEKTGMEIIALLRRLNQEKGQTFIIVTHDPVVAKACDRVAYLRDGVIVGEDVLT